MPDILVQEDVHLVPGHRVFLRIYGENVDSPLPPYVGYRIRAWSSQGHQFPEIRGNSADSQPDIHNLGDPDAVIGGKVQVAVVVIDFDQLPNKYAVHVELRQEGATDVAYHDRQEFDYLTPQRLMWLFNIV